MTLLHQAAQKAVEAHYKELGDAWIAFDGSPGTAKRVNFALGMLGFAIDALVAQMSALQHQEEPSGNTPYDEGPFTIATDGGQEVPREPVAWIRWCSDGGYEGPIMNHSMEEVRKRSGAWTPLYASPSTTRQQEAGSDWRPIESAPKDGTWIAAIGHLGKDTPDTLKWRDGYWWNGYDNYSHEPTHWMPLAAAPSTPEKAGGVSDGVGACLGCGRFYPVHLPGCPHGVALPDGAQSHGA